MRTKANLKVIGLGAVIVPVFLLVGLAPPAAANPLQVLDSLTVFPKDAALGLTQDVPPGFRELLAPGSGDFVDCEADTGNGIICLDQDDVVIWPSLSNPTSSSVMFNCGNRALGLNGRRGNACTAVARDAQGNVYVGGRLNGTASAVLRVYMDPAGDGNGCGSSTSFQNAAEEYLCFDQLATDRPVIEDIDVIQGDQAADFSPDEQKRLLVLEEKKTVLVYRNFEPDPSATIVTKIAGGKREFALNGNEQVLNAALMQYVRPTAEPPAAAYLREGESDFFIVAATDRGRLIAVDVSEEDPAGREVWPLTESNGRVSECATEDESFDVTVSPKSQFGYVTDRNYCLLHVLEQAYDANGDFTQFTNATGSPLSTSIDDDDTGETTFYPPLDVSVSPGIGFDLGDCVLEKCNLIGTAASLADVQLASAASGVTLYQIASIPHCAWIPEVCYELLEGEPPVDRATAVEYLESGPVGVLKKIYTDLEDRPETYRFNVTPLLPTEVTDHYEPAGLPDLWFPPEYRAQNEKSYYFNALFFAPQPGVLTDGVLTLEVDVSDLTGSELGCYLATGEPLLPDPYTLDDLANWDVTVRNSERWLGTGGVHVGTAVNTGCINPTRGRTNGLSIFPVDFEVTPCPFTADNKQDANCANAAGSETIDDAVFAKLYVRLYDELYAHLNELACTTVDDGLEQPFSDNFCATLRSIWLNGEDKLDKALAATFEPKSSAGNENFGSVQSQLQNYANAITDPDADPSNFGADPANRTGEQLARVETLVHVLNDKLLPSIPANGFDDADRTWAE